MNHILCWLWLATKYRIANSKITYLLERFESVEEIYLSRNFNNIRGINEKDKELLLDKDMDRAKLALEKTAKLGGKILVYDDENYPMILKQISDPPYVLYIIGKLPDFDNVLTIGVVGNRESTHYGNTVTEKLCRDLAEAGVVTVGGLALGIDAVGAWATLEAGGMAVGVMACGLDRIYPTENAELYKAVAQNGCLITEYQPGIQPYGTNFPVRNRIIAGLSRGVLVTEAPKQSGSLITARYAFENNRDVFAVPRNITDTAFMGTNILIQQGAKLVNDAQDILIEYPYARKVSPVKTAVKMSPKIITAPKKKGNKGQKVINSEKYSNLNEPEKKIVDLLLKKDMQIDEISRELDIPVGDLNTRLILLEFNGLIRKLPGSKYQIKE